MQAREKLSFRHRALVWASALIMLIGLSACDGIRFPDSLSWLQTPTPAEPELTPTSPAETQTTGTPGPTSTPAANRLMVWLPPLMDPAANNDAAKLLKNRLDSFATSRGISITVRLKETNGPGSMLEALGASKEAAPAAMPQLVVLDQFDLRTAADSALIHPNQGFASILQEADWYGYARQLAVWHNQTVGLPFLGDPLIMAYDAALLDRPPDEWNAMRINIGKIGFAGDDPQGRFLLMLYFNEGGMIVEEDEENTILQVEPLAAALHLLRETEMTSHIADAALQIQTPEQVWQGFDTWKYHYGIMPASALLRGMDQTRTSKIVPTLTNPPISLSTGLAWAVTALDPRQVELAEELAAYLTETEFLGEWSEAVKLLPARPSALGAWSTGEMKASLEQASDGALILPDKNVMDRIGPVLRNATILILRDHADAQETAKQAVESLR